MTTLYDALDSCLQEIENGADVESVLVRFPDIVDELRPILLAAVNAQAISAPSPSKDVVQRNRAKILQRAVEMREERARSSFNLNWFAPVRRLAFTFVILFLVFVSGTSLVGAASTSLPGDDLYPVKRSWERLQVFFLLDAQTRKDLEVDHENERIEELLELFAGRRTADVTFSGLITRQNGNEWLVAGIRVQIAPGTELPDEAVQLNKAVRVHGSTLADGSVLAARIEILSPEDTLPEVENEPQDGEEGQNENESASGESTPVPEESLEPDEVEFDGVLNVRNGDFWTINGMPADVSEAEVIGTPAVGASVTLEGYFNPDGIFIVTKIEFEETDSNSGSGSNSNTNSNDNTNDNSNDNDDNGNDDHNDNDGDDDNSGSGGGGDD